MKENQANIPTLDPYKLKANLLRTDGGHLWQQIQPAHNLFHINKIEDYIKSQGSYLKTDTHPFRLTVFSFMFLTKGCIVRTKGLSTYEIGENSFFFVPAFEISTHDSNRKGIEGYYCHFNLDLLAFDFKVKGLLSDFPFLNFNSHPVIRVEESAKENILNVLRRLDSEYLKGERCSLQVIRAYLIALFMELLPFVRPAVSASDDLSYQVTEQFKRALAQHIFEKQKISDYAALLNISSSRLSKYVKETTGKRASDLLNEMLVLEAKILLNQTSLSISEITYELGQKHVSNFVRFFKRYTGMSPGEYRNMDKQAFYKLGQ
jgi:AraC-like DNA-binding protein